VPAEGLLILRDGEPGEPEVTLSPLAYHYQHPAEIEAVVQGADRVAAFDTLIASIGAALAADRTLGEPPRVYRRVKHSKDEPYDKAENHPRLSGRASRPRCSAFPREPRRLRQRVQAGLRSRSNSPGDCLKAQNAAYKAIAPKLGCSPDSLRVWCQRAERDAGERPGLTSAERDRIKELEREVRELRTANEILKKASGYFAPAELDRPFRK
jgi:transposase